MDINFIYQEYQEDLRRFIIKRVANREDMEDVLQEVLIKIQNNLATIKDEGKVAAWIRRIARNQIIDFYRSRRATERLDDNIPDVADGAENHNKEISICIRNIIGNLPAKYQEAIKLTTYQGLSQQQVAQRLGLSTSGAKSRVQRSRAMIKKMLLRCCQLEFDRMGNIIEYRQKGKTKYC
ncbi:rna polymerase sigma factor 70 region 4 type 2 [Lucifera butyrica]|uniref:RNA polymerase sigma factor SigZ n=1 Tax=Lucifera butyrica TaxID=1351585 RepID=A0A498RBE6_9FIRM|nr:RNA polymerase sigma factor SigZ [Lucifera butyrica]VBB06458.1 rna polymerase sigma factor 70 region 4 type 2 [Lucifera butyrica]